MTKSISNHTNDIHTANAFSKSDMFYMSQLAGAAPACDDEKGKHTSASKKSIDGDLGPCVAVESSPSSHQDLKKRSQESGFSDSFQEFMDGSVFSSDNLEFDRYLHGAEEDATMSAIRNGMKMADKSMCCTIGSYEPFDSGDPSTWNRSKKKTSRKSRSKSKGACHRRRSTSPSGTMQKTRGQRDDYDAADESRDFPNLQTSSDSRSSAPAGSSPEVINQQCENSTGASSSNNDRTTGHFITPNSRRRERLRSNHSVSTRSLSSTASYILIEETKVWEGKTIDAKREQEDKLMHNFLQVLQEISDRKQQDGAVNHKKASDGGAASTFDQERKHTATVTRKRYKTGSKKSRLANQRGLVESTS